MIFNKITRGIRSYSFKRKIKNKNKVKLFGKVNLLNKNVKLGKNVVLYPGVSFEGNGHISLGNNVKIGTNTILYANKDGGLFIDDDTIIAGNCYIIDTNHKYKKGKIISSQGLESAKVEIGKDVWIGANTTVIKGSTIEDGAVVGANSLVNSLVKSNTVVAGTPAKKIKNRE